jgi:hypothetical protein
MSTVLTLQVHPVDFASKARNPSWLFPGLSAVPSDGILAHNRSPLRCVLGRDVGQYSRVVPGQITVPSGLQDSTLGQMTKGRLR